MRHAILILFLAITCLTTTALAAVEDFKVYTERPRLLLNQRRLKLLRRERDRQSLRWNQFELLMKGKAAVPEQAFASALYGQILNEPAPCSTAFQASGSADARQIAIVLDWCTTFINEAQQQQLKSRLNSKPLSTMTFAQARDRVFAAVELEDAASLQAIVEGWWRKSVAPALNDGSRVLETVDMYPFMEMAHALRDNLQIDMRDDIRPVFRDLALRRLLTYYPASYPAPENDYRIPSYDGKGDPDLKLSALTRTSEFALVAYESNAQEMQFLQGWLMLDRFALKSAFGAPYEFLWANPYQPGLPFDKLPLTLHDSRAGMLFARSSWEEDATWFSFRNGTGQLFRDGQIRPAPLKDPLVVGPAMILSGPAQSREFRVAGSAPEEWFLIGFPPRTDFDIEIDDEEMTDSNTDRGGILKLEFTRRVGQAVYVHVPRTTAP